MSKKGTSSDNKLRHIFNYVKKTVINGEKTGWSIGGMD